MKKPESASEQWKQALWNRYRSAANVVPQEKSPFLRQSHLMTDSAEIAALYPIAALIPAEPMEQRLVALFAD